MALIPVDRVIDTVLGLMVAQEATFNTIIDEFFTGKRINFFDALQKSISDSSLPSIEIGPAGDNLSWKFVRVQGDDIDLEIHITTSNKLPEIAMRLESRLVSLVTRILAYPANVRGRIEGTNTWFQDSFPNSVSYGSINYNFNIRVAKVNWKAQILEYLPDIAFPPLLQEGGDHFPLS
jgi:hypothetical protein